MLIFPPCPADSAANRVIDRATAEEQLRAAGVNGGFVLRKKDDNKFIVSVIHAGQCSHHMLSFTGGQWRHKTTTYLEAGLAEMAVALLRKEAYVADPTPLDAVLGAHQKTQEATF